MLMKTCTPDADRHKSIVVASSINLHRDTVRDSPSLLHHAHGHMLPVSRH